MKRINSLNHIKAAVILSCLICLAGFYGKAQGIAALRDKFTAFQKPGLREKLYLQTDKNFYVTGEIVWFKLYNTGGPANKLSDISKVAYIELLDNNHNAVIQVKAAMNNATGNGSFLLPFSINNGNYELRAYTSWMKNFDADYFFRKQITVINPTRAQVTEPKQAAADDDIQFFPEGGRLVKGLSSKVAFKVTAPDGKGQACTGAIVGPQNDTVARFSTLMFGIGSFVFTPSAQAGYKAVVRVGGQVTVKPLPEISADGYVMQAAGHNGNWEVNIQSTATSGGLYLIVHTRNGIIIAEHGILTNGAVHFSIAKSKLAGGVNYVTLFDEQQKPLCERLLFNRPAKTLQIAASAGEPTYATRKKVDIALSANNGNNKPQAANLSVSVFRLDSLQRDNDTHIAAYLWLSADLTGHVESPDYYLDDHTAQADEALDNLVLSQGWRQFDWDKITAGERPGFSFLPEYTGPIITANVTNTLTGKPAAGINAYLTIAGAAHRLYISKSGEDGRLLFNTQNFYGPNEIIGQTNWAQDSTYRLSILSPFSDQYDKWTLPALKLTTDIKNTLAGSSTDMQVQNIFSAKQLQQFYKPEVDSAWFYGKPGYTYKLDDYTRFTSMEEVIHEYVRLISITRDNGKRGFQVENNIKLTLPGRPLALVDGKPIFDADKVFSLDPLKIKRLDVVNTNYIYGPAVLNGILNFTTYNGQSTNMELDPRSIVMDYDGLQLERKFYSPVYDSEQQANNTIPDFRNTLYWNPDAGTDALGKRHLSFYTGDKPGKYIGIVEGITANGEAGTGRFFFEVR